MCFAGHHCCRICPYFSATYYVSGAPRSWRARSQPPSVLSDGHETPFSIKLSQVRGLTRSQSRDDIDNMTAGDLDTVVEDSSSPGQKCEFYLKQKKTPKKHHLEDSNYQKTMKKQKKSQNIIHTLFRRIRPAQPLVFGLPLADICDENLDPPESIIKLMVLVYQQGPTINGILRRGNNASLGKDIREKIDSGVKYTLEDYQAPTAASVFKEFLRCIPDRLLLTDLHEQWIAIKKDDPEEERIEKIKEVLTKLPPAHYRLVKLTICLLQHLAKHSDHTKMGPANLATCIAPSFYPHDGAGLGHGKHSNNQKEMQMRNSVFEITNIFTPLISFMITKHTEIFGEDVLSMFVKFDCEVSPSKGLDEDKQIHASVEEDEEEEEEEEDEEDDEAYNGQHPQKRHRHPLQQHQRQHQMQRDSNSGTDSDSMHSVLSMPDTGIGLRRDDSSIDSLVDREYYPNETESSPKATKSHLSPSNLSRDSGLTLSDTQLYDEDVGDATAGLMKMYQRSASHYVDHHDHEIDSDYYCRSMDSRFDRKINPVPPPRKKGVRKGRESNDGSDNEQPSFGGNYPQRPPFIHSASTTQLDFHPKKGRGIEHRPMHIHPPLNKRVSSESIGEEDEVPEDPRQPRPMDFQRMRMLSDIGTLVKSASGAHLILNEEVQPTRYDLEPTKHSANQHFVRQASVTESTPPVSPQSRYSHSSRDSAISDSAYSISRDGSVYSAPQTPDEPASKSLSWITDSHPPGRQWDGRLAHSLNNPSSSSLSKSTSDLLRDQDDDDDDDYFMSQAASSQDQVGMFYSEKHVQKYRPTLSKLWYGKSHEAEEIEMSHGPHFSLLSSPKEYSIDTNSPLPSTSPQQRTPLYKVHGLPAHLVKGSPPPNIVLQSIQSPPLRRDSAPMKAIHDQTITAQVRRSSLDSIEPRGFDVSKSMSAIKPEEYITVTPKHIMIQSSAEESAASAASKARLSKYVSSSLDLSLSSKDRDRVLSDLKRPQKPPTYQQALQRNFMLKHSVPVDITTDDTEKQKEISARARTLYEQSLQLYNEQRLSKSSDSQPAPIPSSSSEANYSETPGLDSSVIRDGASITSKQYSSAYSDYVRQNSHPTQPSPDSQDDSGASGFLDMGSISHSFQEDVLYRRNARAGSDVSSASQSVSAAGSVSVSRNDSKLSDTGSSSGSSVTVSTLSRHSDSFGRRSDLSNASNITVSSVTSSDSSSDTNSIMSKRKSASDIERRNMAYSRHFRPVEPDNSGSEQDKNLSETVEEDTEDVYVTLEKNSRQLKKDPRQLYLESKQMFEQSAPYEMPSSSSPLSSPLSSILPNKPSTITSSSCVMSSTFPQQSTNAMSISSPHALTISPVSSQTSNALSTFRGRPFGTAGKSTLEVPSSSLQRSRSDSAEHINKLGTYSPRSAMTRTAPQEEKPEKDAMAKPKSPSSDIKSELHQKFLMAKSYFYNPEDDSRTSPAVSPRQQPPSTQTSSALSSSSSRTSQEYRHSNWASHKAASYAEDMSVTSGEKPQSKSNVPSKSSNKPTGESKGKKELPWSVQHLKTLFGEQQDQSRNSASVMGATGGNIDSASSETRPRNPPPYQNPPPFRRHQDQTRNSTSSTSSGGSDLSSGVANRSSSKSNAPNRHGPQSHMYDHFNYSSSEDGYSSSLDRKSIHSSGSKTDSEAISDVTNITYV